MKKGPRHRFSSKSELHEAESGQISGRSHASHFGAVPPPVFDLPHRLPRDGAGTHPTLLDKGRAERSEARRGGLDESGLAELGCGRRSVPQAQLDAAEPMFEAPRRAKPNSSRPPRVPTRSRCVRPNLSCVLLEVSNGAGRPRPKPSKTCRNRFHRRSRSAAHDARRKQICERRVPGETPHGRPSLRLSGRLPAFCKEPCSKSGARHAPEDLVNVTRSWNIVSLSRSPPGAEEDATDDRCVPVVLCRSRMLVENMAAMAAAVGARPPGSTRSNSTADGHNFPNSARGRGRLWDMPELWEFKALIQSMSDDCW